jgi:hypothetical protein
MNTKWVIVGSLGITASASGPNSAPVIRWTEVAANDDKHNLAANSKGARALKSYPENLEI